MGVTPWAYPRSDGPYPVGCHRVGVRMKGSDEHLVT